MASKFAFSSRPRSSAWKWKRVESPSVPVSAVMSSASGPRGVSMRSRRLACVKPSATGSHLLVLLEFAADRCALACGLPGEPGLRVGHLDLRVVQRPALGGDASLTRAADLDGRDHHVR